MITNIIVGTKRLVALPKELCDRRRIWPGTALRVIEVEEGIYMTPIAKPTRREMARVMGSAGSRRRLQTTKEEMMVAESIRAYREERGRKR
jgi:hypothetical protein